MHMRVALDRFDQSPGAAGSLGDEDDERDESLNGYGSLSSRSSTWSRRKDFPTWLQRRAGRLSGRLASGPSANIWTNRCEGGTQTSGMLFGAGHALVEKLRARIEQAVNNYIANLKADDHHPFLSRRTQGFRFAGSWSSRLATADFM